MINFNKFKFKFKLMIEHYRSNMGGPGSGMIPKGVGAPPPPGMDNRRGKLMCIKVRMLDDSVGVFHLGVSKLAYLSIK